MTPPDTVKVNGRVMSIKYRGAKSMPDAAGLFHPHKSLIEINKGQDLQEMQDTVLHETLHAILHTQGREYGGEDEELYVRSLATGLIGVLQDNQEFSRWLTNLPPTPP
jgi:Zn-dependent peptidase ImmA (M78 family)